MRTGKIMWSEKQPGGKSAAVAYADGRLYFVYQDGTIALIGADPKAYELHGLFNLPKQGGNCWAHPVILDGRLYLRWGAKLFCYDVRRP